MLLELVVQNFALLDEVEVEFSPGLNVLTGETGAGKSLLMGALSLVLGERAWGEVVRKGADRASIQARFQLPGVVPPGLREELSKFGVDEDELILSREISPDGRNKCRIGSQLVTVGALSTVGQFLVDIHGQHAHQSLLDPKTHLGWLDDFAGEKTLALKAEFAARYSEYQQGQKRLSSLEETKRSRARELDLLRYELSEIEEAGLKEGEEFELEQEYRRLSGAQELEVILEGNHLALAEDGGIIALLGKISQSLQQVASTDSELSRVFDQAGSLLLDAQELSRTLRTLSEEMVYDPERLAFIEARLEVLERLERKYGKGTEAILAHQKKVEARVAELEGADEDSAQLAGRIKELEEELKRLARALHLERTEAAKKLSGLVLEQLAALRMGQAQFQVQVTAKPWDRAGGDKVEMVMAPNPGEGLAPLAKIASGGELSRIMLALKCTLAEVDKTDTLIFDEIDAGIGGRTLQAVAERLALLGQRRQVICVTHAPQIASMADNHFAISKESKAGRTRTKLSKLAGDSRIEELARMLGGAQLTDLTWGHAKEMLRLAQEQKEGIKEAAGGQPS